MSEKQHGRVWHAQNVLARFAPGAVISIVLFVVFSGALHALIQLGYSKSAITELAGITWYFGLFATVGPLDLLALAVLWVVYDDR